jgi:hypothetical protein
MPQQLLPQQRLEVHISILEDEQVAATTSSSSGAQQGSGQQQEQQQQLLHQRQQQQLHALQQQQQQQGVLLLPTPELPQQPDVQGDAALLTDGSLRDTGEEDFEEAEEEYEELFTDKRWRLVQLRAVGGSWAERVRQLAQDMQQQQQQQQQL